MEASIGKFTAAALALAMVLVAVPAQAPGHGGAATTAAGTATADAGDCEGEIPVSVVFERSTQTFEVALDDSECTNLTLVRGNLWLRAPGEGSEACEVAEDDTIACEIVDDEGTVVFAFELGPDGAFEATVDDPALTIEGDLERVDA